MSEMDTLNNETPMLREATTGGAVTVPVIKGSIPPPIVQKMKEAGYVKARAVVVYPEMQDRKVICQGVANPTLYTTSHRGSSGEGATKDMYAQSSWFFRPKYNPDKHIYNEDVNIPASKDETKIEYMDNGPQSSPEHIKKVEIQGHYKDQNKYTVTWKTLTFHSPDIEFDDSLLNFDYSAASLQCEPVGNAVIARTLSDIDIQTETPTISDKGAGFVKKSFIRSTPDGIISGLFWDDYVVDDDTSQNKASWFREFADQKASAKWMVYLWNRTGSLNNDMDRPADTGVRSAVLKKKIISNLRFASETSWKAYSNGYSYKLHLFSSDQNEIIKLRTEDKNLSNIYKGNIDTLLTPDDSDGMYFSIGYSIGQQFTETDFDHIVNWKTFVEINSNNEYESAGNHWYEGGEWKYNDQYPFCYNPADNYFDLARKKSPVRMKYKSTPHLVLHDSASSSIYYDNGFDNDSLPVIELRRTFTDETNTLFGGRSKDALKENIWIPCGEPVRLDDTKEGGYVEFEYSWGDTYYQRYDCLKTYAFTPEDINQVVEIGSFMLETYVNIDGRYDRNRGQLSNLYMSPQNFNLINPVYSQLNNFFTYRIQDDDAYKEKKFPNQITWSKTKTSGADVDLWTNVTLASTLEMDGDKGSVRKLIRFNNTLFCFQDKGIAQILYNDRVQINTQDGVPIEISNSDKVQGKNYLSDSVGCSNKWSMSQTPSGIYFMDSINKVIFMFNGQLNNLSGSLGFNSWAKNNIPLCNSGEPEWTPEFPEYDGKSTFVSYYDKLNQDVLFINKNTALAYSEKLNAFTSFYDYGNSAYFCNLQDTGIWIREANSYYETPTLLWKHQGGNYYCKFFGEQKPYSMTLIGNPEPQMDKIFTNLEFRACVDGDGKVSEEKFTPSLPFDSLETWNEYQHGITTLSNRNGHSAFKHHDGNDSSLKRKFRIWRCDIPRSNAALALDEGLNCYRVDVRPQDRMRNPWLYLKLQKKAENNMPRAEIHDILMTYFD